MSDEIKKDRIITDETGFENIGYFCRRFKKLYGVTPIYYRNHCHSAE